MADSTPDEILNELVAIKRLMIFAPLRQDGVSKAQIATALGVAQSQVSKLMGSKGG